MKRISLRLAVAALAALSTFTAGFVLAALAQGDNRGLAVLARTEASAGVAPVGSGPPAWAAAPPTATTAPEPVATPETLSAAVRPVDEGFTLDAYRGFGAWVDVYDWSVTFATGERPPPIELADIDRMADLGVQTVYIQTSKWDSPTDVLEPERLVPFIDRAHADGMRVIAWYLPTFEDPAVDLRRLLAAAALDVDGLAVDIESSKVPDIAERSRRLLAVSQDLAHALPGQVLGAIPYPPVATDVINPNLWPGFPWAELAPIYRVWLPMGYWTGRTPASGYHDGYRYTAENIDRLRSHLGDAQAAVHPIGGIGDLCTPEDIEGMVRAATERGALGGSIYDYRTTDDALWTELQRFRT